MNQENTEIVKIVTSITELMSPWGYLKCNPFSHSIKIKCREAVLSYNKTHSSNFNEIEVMQTMDNILQLDKESERLAKECYQKRINHEMYNKNDICISSRQYLRGQGVSKSMINLVIKRLINEMRFN